MNKELEKLLQRVWEAARTTYEQDAMGNYVESTISEPFFDNLHTWIESEKMAPSTGIAAIIDSFDAAFTGEDKGTVGRLNEILECFDEGGVPNLNWVHKNLIALKAALPTQNKEDYTSFTKEALYDWDGYLEVSPVMEDKERGFCEVVDDPDAMFWSVYCHQKSGGVVCVADFDTREQAEEFEGFLKSLLTLSIPSQV